MKTVYIAGKIKGLSLEMAEAKFAVTELYLKKLGFLVFNPFAYIKEINAGRLKNGLHALSDDSEADRKIIIKLLTEKLLLCDMIYLLSCWINSQGAKYEKTVADMCGIETLEI